MMRLMVRYVLVIFFILWGCSVFAQPIELIVVFHKNEKATYRVDGAITDSKNVLKSLNEKKESNSEIFVYLDEKLSLSDCFNVKGLVGKVGFLEGRYFVIFENGKMIELNLHGSTEPTPKFRTPRTAQ